ncbi:hypothetical protein [Methanolapillus millepedarum]|uniref:Uncharacterized protein n=1 Tax=Methanolapillus millepedarum TaxID=3028296 RepID=A0AA96VCK1_9EURY|nr:hypothetical protein MsAc7_12540 [Methanosarcinaceae archaeon Ac7]
MGNYISKFSNIIKMPNVFGKIKYHRRTSKIETALTKLKEAELYDLKDMDEIKERFLRQPQVAEALLFTTTILEKNYASSLVFKIEIEYDWEDECIIVLVPIETSNPDMDHDFFKISQSTRKKFGIASEHVFLMNYIAADDKVRDKI